MSGRRMYTKESDGLSRRDMLKGLLGASVLGGMINTFSSCEIGGEYGHIKGGFVGANYKVGHLLRDGFSFPQPTSELRTNILIAGGGISGLSAMRKLQQAGVEDVMMVELDNNVGGNSVGGKNDVSAYPWGAHYLPIPEVTNTELIELLRSINTITGFDDKGAPIYNEYHLCHAPEERLYINGHWQEGIVPHFGVPDDEQKEIKRFFKLIEELKHTKGSDGLYVFNIPLDNSSQDELYTSLDRIPFAEYLKTKGFKGKHLLWYLEYCCKDDYGANLQDVSAWAGLHYFAARRGSAANADSSALLTWPEGNAYLMNRLKLQSRYPIKTNMLVYKTEIDGDHVAVYCYDTEAEHSVKIVTNKLLLSTPQYINDRILKGVKGYVGNAQPSYAPWMVANVTLKGMPASKGATLSWDNVLYGKDSVGYVHAKHQTLKSYHKTVLTFYLPIVGKDVKTARKDIYSKSYDQWKATVIEELRYAHPEIVHDITNIDIWVWGHGMIRPDVGYIWGNKRAELRNPIDNKIFFAHSDLSGISIFEEAFAQGIRAAKEMISTT